MKRGLFFAIVMFLFFWIGSPPAPAQTAVKDRRTERPPQEKGTESKKRDELRKRWERLPAEKRENLEKRFRHFKKLSPEEQKKLKQRHGELVRVRKAVAARAQHELNQLPPEEKEKRIRVMVEEEIKKKTLRIKEKELPSLPVSRGPDEARSRRLRKALEAENSRLADKILARLLDEEVISPLEWKRLMSLSSRERKSHVVELEKERCLHVLENLLTPQEMEQFRNMKARYFHSELRRQKREKGMPGSLRRLSDLTAEQRTFLKGLPDSERSKQKRLFFDQNLRRRLLDMGVSENKMEGLFSLPLRQKLERIMSLIREAPAEKVPPELRQALRTPSTGRPNGSPRHNGKKHRAEKGGAPHRGQEGHPRRRSKGKDDNAPKKESRMLPTSPSLSSPRERRKDRSIRSPDRSSMRLSGSSSCTVPDPGTPRSAPRCT